MAGTGTPGRRAQEQSRALVRRAKQEPVCPRLVLVSSSAGGGGPADEALQRAARWNSVLWSRDCWLCPVSRRAVLVSSASLLLCPPRSAGTRLAHPSSHHPGLQAQSLSEASRGHGNRGQIRLHLGTPAPASWAAQGSVACSSGVWRGTRSLLSCLAADLVALGPPVMGSPGLWPFGTGSFS